MIDSARIAELHAQGLSQRAPSPSRWGAARNSVKRHLTKEGLLARSKQFSQPSRPKLPVGGASRPQEASRLKHRAVKRSVTRADLAAIERPLADHFERLSLVERMKILLKT